MKSVGIGLASLVVLAACAAAPQRAAQPRRLGEAMDEAGRRFQRAGRAVIAGRWELATYDLHELDEIFEDELAGSSWHGKPELSRLAKQFQTQQLVSLRTAVVAHDRTAFEHAVANAARPCNECHKKADQAYIEISESLGTEVPEIQPNTTATSTAQ